MPSGPRDLLVGDSRPRISPSHPWWGDGLVGSSSSLRVAYPAPSHDWNVMAVTEKRAGKCAVDHTWTFIFVERSVRHAVHASGHALLVGRQC